MNNLVSRATSNPLLALTIAVVTWATSVILASMSGALGALGRVFMPGYAVLVAIGIGLPVLAYFGAPAVRGVVDGIGVHRLTLMHIWRIPAALLFFYYGSRGALPAPFWLLAGLGDLAAGLLATLPLFLPRTRALYRALHLFGFADFVVAVGTGLTFTLLGDPTMATLTTLPMAMIPLFGVGLSGASHIVVLSRLTR